MSSDDAQKFTRRAGIFLMIISAAVFSTAGLFTKGVEADAWSVIFWRGLFAALFTACYSASRKTLDAEFAGMGRAGWVVAILSASGTAAFIPAFKLTTIANVALIYAAAPFIAGGIAWLWFREKPTTAVMIAALGAMFGVALIVGGSIGGLHLSGDLLALWMTLMMSAVMVVYRRYPQTPAAGPAAMSSIFLLPPAMLLGEPFSAPIHEILIMCAFGLVFAVASVTLSEGARRLPPGEAALISSLETPLAPIWAWFIFSELPAPLTVIGGSIILAAVFGSQLAGGKMRENARMRIAIQKLRD